MGCAYHLVFMGKLSSSVDTKNCIKSVMSNLKFYIAWGFEFSGIKVANIVLHGKLAYQRLIFTGIEFCRIQNL